MLGSSLSSIDLPSFVALIDVMDFHLEICGSKYQSANLLPTSESIVLFAVFRTTFFVDRYDGAVQGCSNNPIIFSVITAPIVSSSIGQLHCIAFHKSNQSIKQ